VLERLKALKKPIRVGIIGAGAMGRGLFYQCHITPGIECAAIADIHLARAAACCEDMQLKARIVAGPDEVCDAANRGMVAVCEDGDIIARSANIDVLIDASSAIAESAKFSITAIEHKKHLVLMNAEIDLIFGPYLLKLAREKGVVYLSCDGDQHGVIKHLADDLRLWGFELVMAGNIKGFLDRRANPDTIIPEADKRNLDYRMCTAYTDGTKLNIEMALTANALGLRTSVAGMLGPAARDVHDVFRLFDFNAIRKERKPVVDYILGAEPGGGVFAIGYCESKYQQSMLKYYKMGDGPYYLFYRPYHLCHIEAIKTLAAAVLDGRSFLEPDCGFRTNVFAYAKKPLRRGDRLDGIGGHTCYGLIENCGQPGSGEGLPICLADDVRLVREIEMDEKIMMSDIELPGNRFDFEIFGRAGRVSQKSRI
jgi:predicted homoserine dehydrogenase-like protein